MAMNVKKTNEKNEGEEDTNDVQTTQTTTGLEVFYGISFDEIRFRSGEKIDEKEMLRNLSTCNIEMP